MRSVLVHPYPPHQRGNSEADDDQKVGHSIRGDHAVGMDAPNNVTGVTLSLRRVGSVLKDLLCDPPR